jgi:hypothetical protein
MRRLFCFLGLVFSLAPALSYAKGTFVLSINGVNTDRAKAESNKDRIKLLIINPNQAAIEPNSKPVVDFVHNESRGLARDLVDVWFQKNAEESRLLSEAYYAGGPTPQTLADAMLNRAEQAQRIEEQAWGNDADLKKMVDRSVDQLKNENRVILIPHSQGNLYANRVFAGIFESPGVPSEWKQSVGISGIASAASYIEGTFSRYVTTDQDRIIAALRIIRDTLPANVFLSPQIEPKDRTGHGLQEAYGMKQHSPESLKIRFIWAKT